MTAEWIHVVSLYQATAGLRGEKISRLRPPGLIDAAIHKDCDGPKAFPEQLWLYVDSSGRTWPLPEQLGSNQLELIEPLDFVDLLGDGFDEVLFLAAGYDAGRYVL